MSPFLTDLIVPPCDKPIRWLQTEEVFMTETLEIVGFRLKPGTEQGFVAANNLVNDWLARQPGFLNRCLARHHDDNWVDVVRWQSREQALAAAGRILAEIGDCEAMQAIDPASVDMHHAAVALSTS
jgi:hypothetical protein